MLMQGVTEAVTAAGLFEGVHIQVQEATRAAGVILEVTQGEVIQVTVINTGLHTEDIGAPEVHTAGDRHRVPVVILENVNPTSLNF
jgi:hypothetical protein